MERLQDPWFLIAIIVIVLFAANVVVNLDASDQSILFDFEDMGDITSASITDIPATSIGFVMLVVLVVVLGFLYFRSVK